MATRLWLPSDLPTPPALWIKVREPAAIVKTADGTRVQSFINTGSVGGSADARTTSNAANYIAEGQNGLPTASWTGGRSSSSFRGLAGVSTTSFALFGVAKAGPPADTQFIHGSHDGARFDSFFTYGGNGYGFNFGTGDISSGLGSASAMVFGINNDAGKVLSYVNGVQGNGATIASPFTFPSLSFGTYAGGTGSPLTGQFAEYLLILAALSEADRQRVVGYLAWVHGTQADLPSNHPYKAAAPTIENVGRRWTPEDATSATLVARWVVGKGEFLVDGKVDSWRSTVGNMYANAEDASRRPTKIAASAIDGKPEIRAYGAQRLKIANRSLPVGDVPSTFMVVAANDGNQDSNVAFGWGDDYNSCKQMAFKHDRIIAVMLQTEIHSEFSMVNRFRTGIAFSRAGSPSSAEIRHTGQPIKTVTGTTGTNDNDAYVFARPSFGDRYLNGAIREVAVWSGTLSDSEILKLQGYAAWQHNTVGDLPTNNPYRTAPPMTGAPALWTPDDLPVRPLVWFDASDTGTMKMNADGVPVASWASKGSYGISATQSNTSQQPIYSADAMNGKPAVLFDGTGVSLTFSAGTTLPYGAMPHTISAVAADKATDGAAHPVIGWGNSQDGGWRVLLRAGSGKLVGSSWGSKADTESQTLWSNTGRIVDWTHTGVNDSKLYMDTALAVYKSTTGDLKTTSNTTCFLGYASTAVSQWLGPISEIIVLGYVPTNDDLMRLQGYRAWKWNLVDKLPNDHPYKMAAPTNEVKSQAPTVKRRLSRFFRFL